ncbi:MAG: 16S rRNA (adenine(1518)-N(6)/adenine(1519)-N(6))-dimethyltransferase RsmA [Candidatus Nomurabacteria bacterium]|nr:16S rRNA (adenine(1518)-N(6)/adenine(1519)-N(6))-dimethyltransferase RsmA [Candidatus Nomurabacteria bacterium]
MKNKKSLGQHWLREREILLDIVRYAVDEKNVVKNTTILEIGSGLGTLTSAIFKFFDKVVAVEYDPELSNKLSGQFPGKNLTSVNADFLQFNLSTLPKNYFVIANVPYYITSPIVQKLLTAKNRPKKIVLLVQKEVAERLAMSGGKSSILGLSANIYAKTRLGMIVPKELFVPPPKVDSQVVILDVYEKSQLGNLSEVDFFKIVKLGFSSPRKKLVNNLTRVGKFNREELLEHLRLLSVNPNARPENLSVSEWKNLVLAIVNKK